MIIRLSRNARRHAQALIGRFNLLNAMSFSLLAAQNAEGR